jgi:hypothetical protein
VPHRSHERSEKEATACLVACKARPDGHAPWFTREKLPVDVAALIAHSSTPEPPPAQRWRGRPRRTPPRVWEATSLSAQGDKRREPGRVVEVRRRLSCGTRASITKVLGGQQSNTAYGERDNLTWRQTHGRLVRTTLAHSTQSYCLRRHLELEEAVFHCVRPHQALRRAVSPPMPGRQWQQRSPAMAAGLPDHIWSLEELLAYRVPPPKD